MQNNTFEYPHIEIEWIHDNSLDPEAVEFLKKIDDIMITRGKRCAGYAWVGDPEKEDSFGILIEVDDELMEQTHSCGARIALYGDDRHPVITLTEERYCEIRDGEDIEWSVYHEIGHYMCGHMNGEIGYETNETYIESRIEGDAVRLREECEADFFASHYVAPEEVLDSLSDRENDVFSQKICGNTDKRIADAQLKEFSVRISSLADKWNIEI